MNLTPATRCCRRPFFAARKADPYSPTAPTLIARRFDENREIPEARVRAMLEQVVTSPLVPRVAKLIESRLKRPLEPFDIWYSGFRPGSQYSEAQLDEMVAKKYPTAQAYQQDIPNLLASSASPPNAPNTSPAISWSIRRAGQATPWARKCAEKKRT